MPLHGALCTFAKIQEGNRSERDSEITTMKDLLKRVFDDNYEALVNNMDCKATFAYLISKGVLTTRKAEEVRELSKTLLLHF